MEEAKDAHGVLFCGLVSREVVDAGLQEAESFTKNGKSHARKGKFFGIFDIPTC